MMGGNLPLHYSRFWFIRNIRKLERKYCVFWGQWVAASEARGWSGGSGRPRSFQAPAGPPRWSGVSPVNTSEILNTKSDIGEVWEAAGSCQESF